MYPYKIIFGMTLYDILLAVGVVTALIILRVFADRDKIEARLYNFCLITSVVSIILGYGGAVLTQAVYNWLDSGVFEIAKDTGATFLGGLIGGVTVFLIVYFGIGHFYFPKKDNIGYFPRLLDIAPICVTAAHGIGRIGCLMAGCCHGDVTDEWYGIYHVRLEAKIVPVQLFEAIFLFVLCGFLIYLAVKKQYGIMAVYMFAYGGWRFFAEYLRADERGSTVVDFLSPSQLTSLILIIGSVAVFLFSRAVNKKTVIEESVSDDRGTEDE